MQFDLRDGSNRSTFKCQTLVGSSKVRRHPVLLNAIVINPINPLYFAVAGSDRYARIYDIRKVPWGEQNIDDNPVIAHVPAHLKGKGPVNATALAYSYQEEVLVSYNDEHVYLFGNSKVSGSSHQASEEGKTPISTSELQVYKGHRNSRTVKGVNFFGLNSEYVVSGSDCGNVFIWKKKNSELIALFKGDTQIVNCLEPHPHIPVLATSGLENTAKIWGPISDEDYAALADDAEMIMELNRRGREESSEYFSNVMHVLRLQRRHVQPELASWYSQGEDRGHPGENSDDEGNAADDYMMVLYTATDNEEDEQMNGQECNIS